MQTALLSYFPGMYYYMDPTYVLVIIGAVICMLASANVSRTFNKYSRYHSKRGLTGARRVLSAAAMTYITATVSTLLQLLRLVLLFGRRDND